MDIIARIETLRKEKGWTKYRLAEESLLTYSTLSSMYARETPPKLDILQMICEAFGVTLSQFFLENEEMEVVTDDEKELLQNYRRLPEDKKNAVKTLINN